MDLLGMSARWYTRRIGPVEFIILDANDPTNADQLQFLKGALIGSGEQIALGRALKDLSGSLSKEVKRCPWAPVPPGPMLFATRRLPLLPVTARAMSSSPARGDRLRG